MQELENIFFDSRESFRNWLEKNHEKSSGIWMVFFKKHTKIKCIEYKEALEEALCFGWIDSIIKKVDERQYIRKFTPRTNISNWSDYNKQLIISLIEKGKMTEAGLKKIDVFLKKGKIDWNKKELTKNHNKNDYKIPVYISKFLEENEPALANLKKLAPSYRKQFIKWINNARMEKTRIKRLQEAVELLKENKRLGIK